MSSTDPKKEGAVSVTSRQVRNPSESSSDHSHSSSTGKAPSLKSPRTARFAEATAVISPIKGPESRNNFNFDLDNSNTTTTTSSSGATPRKKAGFRSERPDSYHFMPQPQVSDVGFGYVNRHESVEMPNTDDYDSGYDYPAMKTPMKSPLKSAMKTPGAPPRDFGGIMSPTFREEDLVEKAEKHTDNEQKRDVAIKARVRLAKILLRGVNFSCSLIVLSMLAASFSIFNATKELPARNTLPPWAANQKIWPQVTVLAIATISLLISMLVFYGYYRAGHRGATKYAAYYSYFAVAWFVFSIVMWLLGAGILQSTRSTSNKSNMWGWACNQNERRQLFQQDVSYDLICRLQNWSLLCCIIEVVVELITIAVYVIVFYRFYSKNKLRKSMATRDRARSDLYMAQLRSECAPPTPGLHIPYREEDDDDEDENDMQKQQHGTPEIYNPQQQQEEQAGVQYVNADQKHKPAPFKLQAAPPSKGGATPKLGSPVVTSPSSSSANATGPLSPGLPTSMSLQQQSQVQSRFQQQQQQQQPQIHSPFLSPSYQQQFPYPLMSPSYFGGPGGAEGDEVEVAVETQQEHFSNLAPGEQVYASVPVPGAYEAPLSPGYEREGQGFGGFPR